MGPVFSVLSSMRKILFTNHSGLPLEEVPICYLRQEDYSITGIIRDGAQDKWTSALFSSIHLDLKTRHQMFPIIQKRMDRMEASLKYTNMNLEYLDNKFPLWNARKIYEIHDLFQAFEVDGDGLIEIAEMSVGLDNLGDKTSKAERIKQLSSGDEDGTGSIDFEEFLQILSIQEKLLESGEGLGKTFAKVNQDVKMMRWMSTVQQINAGYL